MYIAMLQQSVGAQPIVVEVSDVEDNSIELVVDGAKCFADLDQFHRARAVPGTWFQVDRRRDGQPLTICLLQEASDDTYRLFGRLHTQLLDELERRYHNREV